jgi:hypothetical protein
LTKRLEIGKHSREEITMLFMLVTRPKAGTTRDKIIAHLTSQIHSETWELIRHGELSHILYKVGDEPGFFAILNAPSFEDAKAMVARSAQRLALFEVEIVPVKEFPHFD